MQRKTNPETEALLCEKNDLREEMRRKLKEFTANSFKRDMEARQACEFFLDSTLYEEARNIFIFMSFGREIDTSRLILQGLRDNKKIALPRTVPGTKQMDFYFLDPIKRLADQVEEGAFGITEPLTSLMKVELDKFPVRTIFIIPGLAFSQDGGRVGKGGGYYDRYLSLLYSRNEAIRLPSALVGFGYSIQVLDRLPVCKHDIPITHILTGNGLVECS
jgi:5-formyltetrahydrofolate cyclo-ligase